MTEVSPQSEDAEREVLGSLMVWRPAMAVCRELGLQPEHFYLDRHRAIFRGAVAAAIDGVTGDELAVWTAIDKAGLSSEVDRHYVSEIAAQVRAASNVRHHALRVVELAARRSKLAGAQLIQQGAQEHDEERSGALIQEGLEMIVADFVVDAEPTSRAELAEDFLAYIENDDPAEVFELPWPKLNPCVLGGLRRGEVLVLGGWSNMGKSFVLDQMLRAFTKQGKSCAIFAPEMSRRERVARYVTTRTGIAIEKLLLKQLDDRDRERVRAAMPEIPFDYFECHGWSAERIAERMVYGNYDVVAVDSVTMIPGFEETKIASRAVGRFAEVARRGDMHMILVSHLNRKRAQSLSGVLPRPVKSDLRDSGMTENYAHQILFLHMDQDEDANVLPTGEIYFDKVKNGIKGKIEIELSPRHLQFVERLADDELTMKLDLTEGPAQKPAHDTEPADIFG